MKRLVIATGASLLLAACGSTGTLTTAENQSLPPRAYGAQAQPTPEQLLTANQQQRPRRNVELLTQSEPRLEDPFDLPPPN